MKKFSINSGFTLLEMLVVIGIIGIIVSMGFVSYSTAQKKARDAKRKSDLKSIQNCLEQYYSYNNNFKYPITANGNLASPLSCGLSSLTTPTDPKTADAYQITDSDAQGSKYTICSPVVSGTSRLEAESCTSGINCCVSNLQ